MDLEHAGPWILMCPQSLIAETAVRSDVGDKTQETSKAFFSEEKKQKTFGLWCLGRRRDGCSCPIAPAWQKHPGHSCAM
jgi:hypothetical protein